MSALPVDVHRFGGLVVDEGAREVLVDGESVHLTKTEFDLLVVLVREPRRAFSRDHLIELVWGPWHGDGHMVNVHISNVRRKIGDGDRFSPLIRTLHGVGYRFDGLPSESDAKKLHAPARSVAGDA
jgi:DNA-binding response OmpR family regulator